MNIYHLDRTDLSYEESCPDLALHEAVVLAHNEHRARGLVAVRDREMSGSVSPSSLWYDRRFTTCTKLGAATPKQVKPRVIVAHITHHFA